MGGDASSSSSSAVRLRSIYVSSCGPPVGDTAEAPNGGAGEASSRSVAKFNGDDVEGAPHEAAAGVALNQFMADSDVKDSLHPADPLMLPESTHSLLFIESICSLPWMFSFAIAMLSFMCLWLAFENNINSGSADNRFNIPANVTTSVRVAQYLSILIALLMEEEIPTGLFLLRQIQQQDFHQKFPSKRGKSKKYWKFVLAAIFRILSGYFFLINVFVILVQATGVIEIFYDVLALQFVQQLDDIAFNLAKIDVLGNRLQKACTSPVFRQEFEKQKVKCKKSDAVLKALYFLNLFGLVAGMVVVSTRQLSGHYQCNSITVNFNDEIWYPARALNVETGQYEDWTLIFSYFNGVYEKNGTHAGRPVYSEMRKFDRTAYEGVIPAEIRYCEDISAWIFAHEHIRKNDDESADELGCNWLMRTEETDEFDLLNYEGYWSIWTGVVGKTEIDIICNECVSNVDCNLNGKCMNGLCQCKQNEEVQYLGTHCETRLSEGCKTIIGERGDEMMSVEYYNGAMNETGPLDTLFQEYARPVYTFIGDEIDGQPMREDDVIWLMFTGRRWFGIQFNMRERNITLDELYGGLIEFHAFWNRAYSTVTTFVSDPSNNPTPVGMDW
ncbi:hypothetical protein ACHAXT_002675 [Thalassiosira profunda]